MSNSLRLHGLQPIRLLCPWGFPRQEYWGGLPCPPPGDLSDPGIELGSPALQAGSLPLSHQGSSNGLAKCQYFTLVVGGLVERALSLESRGVRSLGSSHFPASYLTSVSSSLYLLSIDILVSKSFHFPPYRITFGHTLTTQNDTEMFHLNKGQVGGRVKCSAKRLNFCLQLSSKSEVSQSCLTL